MPQKDSLGILKLYEVFIRSQEVTVRDRVKYCCGEHILAALKKAHFKNQNDLAIRYAFSLALTVELVCSQYYMMSLYYTTVWLFGG